MILLIDNYDSFSYNLYQLIGEISPDIKVVRNDELTVSDVAALAPSHIVISPGPGRPEDAGISIELVKQMGKTTPILGVCLGHQAICTAFGAHVGYAERMMHGKQSIARFDVTSPLFKGMSEEVLVARYHSLAADRSSMNDSLKIIATTVDSNEIMAVEHQQYPVYVVQFHPESILTPDGRIILQNFLAIKGVLK